MSKKQYVAFRQKPFLSFHLVDCLFKPGTKLIKGPENIVFSCSARNDQQRKTFSNGPLKTSGSGIVLQVNRLIWPQTGHDCPAFFQVQLNLAPTWVKWTHSL